MKVMVVDLIRIFCVGFLVYFCSCSLLPPLLVQKQIGNDPEAFSDFFFLDN